MATNNKWSVKGRIIEVLPAKSGTTDKGEYSMQEYVMESDTDYPFKLAFTVMGADKINYYNLKVGDYVEVSFNVTSKKWKEKWITSVRAWKVKNMSNTYQQPNNPAPQSYVQSPQPQKQESKNEATDVNNLPF